MREYLLNRFAASSAADGSFVSTGGLDGVLAWSPGHGSSAERLEPLPNGPGPKLDVPVAVALSDQLPGRREDKPGEEILTHFETMKW